MADHSQPVPKYYKIYKGLLEQIENGKFKPHDRFYSDTELVEKYEVSRGTIREAVKLLIQEGYLYREQGKGTFVTSPTIKQESDKLMGFTELMRKYKKEPSAKVIDKQVVAPPENIINLMDINETDKLVYLVRVRYGDGQPMIIERSYFVYDLFKPIYDMDLQSNSIYELVYEHTDIRLGEATQYISAVKAKQPEINLLNVEQGDPLLLMTRLIHTKDGGFFQYSKDVYRSDRINFTTTTEPFEHFHDDHGLPLELSDNSW